jgi:phage terminase large subunit
MKIVFDTNENDKQKQVCMYWIDDTTSDIVYGGSKGSGKSYLGASLIFGDALIYPETHYFIARKKLNDLRKFTIPTIHEVFKNWGLTNAYFKYNGQDNFYQLYNGSKVFLLEAKYLPSDPQYMRFGSMQMTRGMIEEAGEFEKDAKENLEASIGRWKNDEYGLRGKLLQTCNPSKNYLYKDYYQPNKRNELADYKKFVQAFPEDNKMLDKGYLENLNRVLSKNAKERLLKGNWEYDDDPNVLCGYENILALFDNDHVPGGKKYITADIARMGSDKAVIMVWEGYKVIELIEYAVSKLTDIQNAIQALRTKHNIPNHNCIADEDGVGGGVVDNCKIKGFVNNSKALKGENYSNLKAQCGYKLAEHVEANEIHFECDLSQSQKEAITEELEQLKSYDSDGEGKLKILPKEQIKDNIGRSPDYLDTMLMRCYFDYASNGNYTIGSV